MQEQVLEYFNNYFDGNLTEDTTNEDIMDAVEDLVLLTEAVCDAVGLTELSRGFLKKYKEKALMDIGKQQDVQDRNNPDRRKWKGGDASIASKVGAEFGIGTIKRQKESSKANKKYWKRIEGVRRAKAKLGETGKEDEGHVGGPDKPEHDNVVPATKKNESTWYPNSDILIENVAGQYRAKQG